MADIHATLDSLFDDSTMALFEEDQVEAGHIEAFEDLGVYRKLSHARSLEDMADHPAMSAAGHAFAFDPISRLTLSDCDFDAFGRMVRA